MAFLIASLVEIGTSCSKAMDNSRFSVSVPRQHEKTRSERRLNEEEVNDQSNSSFCSVRIGGGSMTIRVTLLVLSPTYCHGPPYPVRDGPYFAGFHRSSAVIVFAASNEDTSASTSHQRRRASMFVKSWAKYIFSQLSIASHDGTWDI